MSDKTVHIWSAFCGGDGMPLGGQPKGLYLDDNLFMEGFPINKAVSQWKEAKGPQHALAGTNDDQDYTQAVKRTMQWYSERYPIQYMSEFSKEELEEMETIMLSFQIPFGSQVVLDVLNRICPNDYEAFPIEIDTPTGVSRKFFLINVCNRIENALDEKNCIHRTFGPTKKGELNYISHFKRLLFNPGCMGQCHLGRMYEHMGRVMVSQKVVDAFQKAGIYGFNVEVFEDRVNGRYNSNYMPDGKTLKV